MVCMCADCAHIYPRPVKSERGCPTHSRLWNEWGSISLTTIRHVRIDGQSPTHSKTANVWGTRPNPTSKGAPFYNAWPTRRTDLIKPGVPHSTFFWLG